MTFPLKSSGLLMDWFPRFLGVLIHVSQSNWWGLGCPAHCFAAGVSVPVPKPFGWYLSMGLSPMPGWIFCGLRSHFEGVDGGLGRCCRGATSSDNSGNYYATWTVDERGIWQWVEKGNSAFR